MLDHSQTEDGCSVIGKSQESLIIGTASVQEAEESIDLSPVLKTSASAVDLLVNHCKKPNFEVKAKNIVNNSIEYEINQVCSSLEADDGKNTFVKSSVPRGRPKYDDYQCKSPTETIPPLESKNFQSIMQSFCSVLPHVPESSQIVSSSMCPVENSSTSISFTPLGSSSSVAVAVDSFRKSSPVTGSRQKISKLVSLIWHCSL